MKKLFNLSLVFILAGSLAHAGSFSGAVDPTARQAAAAAQSTANTALANYNPASVAITGGTINGATTASVAAVAAGSAYNPASVAITGGSATGLSNLTVSNAGAGGSITDSLFTLNAGGGQVVTGTATANTELRLMSNVNFKMYDGAAYRLLIRSVAPTISSGFGTSPSIVSSNGTAAFVVGVGTGGTASNGVVALPAAQTGWVCAVANSFQNATAITTQTATTTTTATFTNQVVATGAALAWPSGASLRIICMAY